MRPGFPHGRKPDRLHENFRRALLLAQSGRADAVFFTPFNKKAMRLAYEGYDDEIRFVRDVLKTSTAASEFNVLGKLWNARVTSHIPLSQVASAISEKSILRSLTLFPDRLSADAEPDRAAVTVLPGESVTFTVRSSEPLDAQALTRRPVLRSVNDLT